MIAEADKAYADKEARFAAEGRDMREVERILLLRSVDRHWMDHIDAMDQLRQGIGLRAYGQRDPVIEYKMEGFNMFEEMISNIQQDTVRLLFHVSVKKAPVRREAPKTVEGPASPTAGVKRTAKAAQKVGRNDPCPCGSGKKYKQCCGKNA